MNKEARASLAEQILSNPLYEIIMAELEEAAIERLVYADNDKTRLEGQLRVQAVRSFRSDCEACLRSTREPRAAPA